MKKVLLLVFLLPALAGNITDGSAHDKKIPSSPISHHVCPRWVLSDGTRPVCGK